jgi:hypothetical protein
MTAELPDERRTEYQASIPAPGRFARPEEVAAAVRLPRLRRRRLHHRRRHPRRRRPRHGPLTDRPNRPTQAKASLGMLDGKTLLVTGVLMESSIAFHVAKIAQEEGATVILTSFGRTMKITQTIAGGSREPPRSSSSTSPTRSTSTPSPTGYASTPTGLDGVLHSIGFAPQGASPSSMDRAGRTSRTAVHVSAYSLKALAVAALPADERGRVGRRPDLRRHRRVAGLRLDGRGQGRLRVDEPLPGPRPRAEGHPLQPRRGRPDRTTAGQVDPRLRGGSRSLGHPRAARLGRRRPGARPPRRARAAVGLVPGDDRRDRPRRRRRPRDGSPAPTARRPPAG